MSANRLAAEKSPYLLQHKDNPVWWHPWGPEAFADARTRDVPVFLSIGYSTCHWCHVMAHESFEDAEVAAALNERFVAIKLDREERPDVDAIYMDVVQALSGHGGWPMSVFLTPDGHPFFGGTYFPQPAFLELLDRVATLWRTRRADLDAQGARLAAAVSHDMTRERAGGLDAALLARFAAQWRGRLDPLHGGPSGAPKFPHPYDLRLLLRLARRGAGEGTLAVVTQTLDAMARGGIYDHLGGGFHRYAVDAAWRVPHFEKMLYDQASLALTYLEAFELTGRREYELVCRETLDYVLRDLAHPEGGFYSAEDADSEGAEGTFYVFTAAELREALPPDEFDAFVADFAVSDRGNFEHGANVLSLAPHATRDARGAATAQAMRRLFERRARRVRPHLDDKVLVDWNGLAIASLARAGRTLGEVRYVEAAARAARFLLGHCRDAGGALLHRWRDGAAGIPGFLDDHAFLAHGLIEIYEATFDAAWLEAALELTARIEARFRLDARGDYALGDGNDQLVIARRVEATDNVVPAGRSVVAFDALRLAKLTADASHAARAREIFAATPAFVREAPHAFAMLLMALDGALDLGLAVAVAGPLDDPRTQALVAAARGGFRPNLVVAAGPPEGGPGLLQGRAAPAGSPLAYVCEHGGCAAPTADPAQAAALAGRCAAFTGD